MDLQELARKVIEMRDEGDRLHHLYRGTELITDPDQIRMYKSGKHIAFNQVLLELHKMDNSITVERW